MNSISVIGGGAAGMMAAVAAAMKGAKVIILEKNPRVGKKILSTGNGRCNFTNINAKAEDYNSAFAEKALEKLPPSKVRDLFKKMGLLSRVESEGRVYPASGQASAVLDILRMELANLKVEIRTEFDAAEIRRNKDGFEVVSASGECVFSDKVIVAAGGCAAPKSGSDGSGYRLLKMLGHKITPLTPSLVQIKTDKGIKGVRAYGKVTLEDGKSEIGEIQFNDYGLSGIPVFCLSKYVKKGMKVKLDLLPDMDYGETEKYLKGRMSQILESYLVGIVNKPLGQLLLKDCGVAPLSRMSSSLSSEEIGRIVQWLKGWMFTVTGIMPWENAQVTAGGAELSEFDSETMESKLVNGLYAAGEVLDIDGACGGYNLQWAWASGFAAGSGACDV